MKINVFNGSPRAEKGNTSVMVEAFLQGARDAGAETEHIFLTHKKIHHCVGCFACWEKTPGVCAIKDDMADLLRLMRESDILVYASPVYVGGVTGIMKDFIDRVIPLADPHVVPGPNDTYRHPERYPFGVKTVLISNCGFPGQYHFKYFRSTFQYLVDHSSMTIMAEIYRGGGAILNNTSVFLAPTLNKYKALLRAAGKEVVTDGKLSDSTKEALEQPLIPPEIYLREGNKYWDSVAKRAV